MIITHAQSWGCFRVAANHSEVCLLVHLTSTKPRMHDLIMRAAISPTSRPTHSQRESEWERETPSLMERIRRGTHEHAQQSCQFSWLKSFRLFGLKQNTRSRSPVLCILVYAERENGTVVRTLRTNMYQPHDKCPRDCTPNGRKDGRHARIHLLLVSCFRGESRWKIAELLSVCTWEYSRV